MAGSPDAGDAAARGGQGAYPDAIVFFRMGDFYEMFGDDAVLGSKLLELHVDGARSRQARPEIPMAGVPHHAAHGYITRLLEGSVSRWRFTEQMADPSKVKGLVPREVVRVITPPGLVTDEAQRRPNTNNFLCAVEVTASAVGIALYDLSTGELQAGSLPNVARVLGELGRAAPREVLIGASADAEEARASALAAAARSLPKMAVREDSELQSSEEPAALREVEADAAPLAPEVRRAVARALRFCAGLSAARAHSGAADRAFRAPSSTVLLIERGVAQLHLELTGVGLGQQASDAARCDRRQLFAGRCAPVATALVGASDRRRTDSAAARSGRAVRGARAPARVVALGAR